jgi:hypothetical protein
VLQLSLRPALREATYKELAALIDPNFLRQGIRARALRGVYFQGFFNPNQASGAGVSDTMWFKVTSSLEVYNGLMYDCFVRFLAWDEIGNDVDLNNREKAMMCLWTSDLQLDCNDMSFKYWGYQYILTQLNASIRPQQIFPHVRNPHLQGVVCKHLNRVLKALPFHTGDIAKEISKQFGGKLDQRTQRDISRVNQLQVSADQGLNIPPERYAELTQQQRLDMEPEPENPDENPPDNGSPY